MTKEIESKKALIELEQLMGRELIGDERFIAIRMFHAGAEYGLSRAPEISDKVFSTDRPHKKETA